jgi:hypothetical protein
MESNDGWSIDADLAFPHMENLGWQIEPVPWRTAQCDWNCFAAVYIGTPWDYPQEPMQFIKLLETIDQSQAILVNDLSLVKWTVQKTYLRDLVERGVDIVSSAWFDTFSLQMLQDAFNQFDVAKVIVKPVISTNATDTYLLQRDFSTAVADRLAKTFDKRAFVVQPFIENIQREGEYSLFYFAAKFSHAVRKVPVQGDFRVQEEYGAEVISIQAEQALIDAGGKVLGNVSPIPVYARLDFVRDSAGRFLLMELELIEPSMYLRMDEDAPRRFAEAFDDHIANVSGGNRS